MNAETFVAILNSDAFSFFKMRFIQHTQKWEIGNLRQMPLVMPNKVQQKALAELATLAMSAKRHEFDGTPPTNELVSRVRELGEALRASAPSYLRPCSAQGILLEPPADCLEVIEKKASTGKPGSSTASKAKGRSTSFEGRAFCLGNGQAGMPTPPCATHGEAGIPACRRSNAPKGEAGIPACPGADGVKK